MYEVGDYVVITEDTPNELIARAYVGFVAQVIGTPFYDICEIAVCGLEDGAGAFTIPTKYLEPYEEDCYHDSHYKTSVLEPILVMQKMFTHEEFIGFLKGNILKYRLRLGHKDDIQKEMDKIQRYEQWLEEAEQGKEITL